MQSNSSGMELALHHLEILENMGGGVCLQGHNSDSELPTPTKFRDSYIPSIRRNCGIDPIDFFFLCPAVRLTRCSHCPLVSCILQSVTCPSTASRFTVNFIWIIFIHVLPPPHFGQNNTI